MGLSRLVPLAATAFFQFRKPEQEQHYLVHHPKQCQFLLHIASIFAGQPVRIRKPAAENRCYCHPGKQHGYRNWRNFPSKGLHTAPYELLTPIQAPISSLAESFFGHKFSYLYSEKTILDESLRRCTAFFNASIPSALSVNSFLVNRLLSQYDRQATNPALSSRNPAESLRRCTAFFNASIPRLNAIAVNINLT